MTDNTQSEALDFADWLDWCGCLTSKSAAAELRRQHARIADLGAHLEAIGACGVSALMGAASAGSDGVASPPLPGAQEAVAPHGWLYDWTHSSATGRPDETYTGFTKDEQHARKHDNCTPVYTAPQPALSAGWQKIETAPKDGTPLLLRSKKGRIADGSWITATSSCGGWTWAYVNLEPIEWQPLPVEPSMDGESK